MSSSSNSAGCGCLFLIAILGAAAFAGYNVAENYGWVSHTAAVDLSMDPNWLVGENRQCASFHSVEPDAGMIKSLSCPLSMKDQEAHNVTVKFWGKIDRPFSNQNDPSAGIHNWRCTRTADGFVCRALD
jgi:hypothetical protein